MLVLVGAALLGGGGLAPASRLPDDVLADAVAFFQSNHEGELVTWIQQAYPAIDGVIINPGAYTHTSIAIPDALRILKCPIIELHFNNSYRYADRKFRQLSHVRPVATGVIFGFGAAGWLAAIEAMKLLLDPPFDGPAK